MALDLLFGLLWLVASVILGGYILLFGRRELWATLGIILLVVTLNISAIFVAGVDTGRDLLMEKEWLLLGIALGAGALGLLIGRFRQDWATLLIGFVWGADLALWLYDISSYVITTVANMSDQVAIAVGLTLMIAGGVFGVWFVRSYRDEALILISVFVGVEIIFRGVGLSATSNLTAIIVLSLALIGVIVQYADLLRGLKGKTPLAQYPGVDDLFTPPE